MTYDSYAERVAFLIELATRLHTCGTTAQRLEGAISAVATRLGLRCEPWANPTGLILSFSESEPSETRANTTQVIRLAPGDVDLRKLCAVDAIAEAVLRGDTSIAEAMAQLQALDTPGTRLERGLGILSFGLTSAAVAILFRGSWVDAAVAGGIGLMIGLLYALGAQRARLSESLELIAALMTTLIAAFVATFWLPLSLKTVIVAALIVLVPGLTLTNAVSELTSQQLVAGTARFAGALASLLKLAFGSMIGAQLAVLLQWTPLEHVDFVAVPGWSEWLAVLTAAAAFAILFKAAWRDWPWVMLAVILAYVSTRLAGLWLSGSVGFRGVSSMLEQNIALGLDTAMHLTLILVALVGGMLIGNVLVPARRNL